MRITLFIIAAWASCASPARAQDMDLAAKWSAYAVVRYVVTGAYQGEPTIISSGKGQGRKAKVTDRVQLTFDWNQNETSLVGTVKVTNSPSAVALIEQPGCPPTRLTGTYDHWEVASAEAMANLLQLAGKRSYPAGALPASGDNGSCVAGWDEVAARTESVEMQLQVFPTMFFGMPQAMGADMSISKDGKSIVFVDQPNGWTWTFTPTPVN
jgi:hypothetical protein